MARRRREEALALISHALKVSIQHSLPTPALRAHFNLLFWLMNTDEFTPAVMHMSEGVELAGKLGDQRWEWMLITNALYPLYVTGRWSEALARAGELPPPEDLREQHDVLGCLVDLVPIHVHRNQLEEAHRLVAAAAGLEASSETQNRAALACARAHVLRGDGDGTAAVAAGRQAFDHVTELGSCSPVQEGLVVAVESALAGGDLDTADELLDQVARLKKVDVSKYLGAQASRLRAQVAARRGAVDAAEEEMRSAEAAFARMEAAYALAVTRLEHGELLAGTARSEEGKDLIASARVVFEGLETPSWVRRAGDAEKLETGVSYRTTRAPGPP
jgi:ATP/maltotriose-dependent transcriptional regulator MalT